MAGDPSVGKINVEIRADDSKMVGDMQRAAQKARQQVNDMFGKVEADARMRLTQAAYMEATAPGQLQRKMSPGEMFLERVRTGVGNLAGSAAGIGVAGAAAFGAFRTGNAIERFINGGSALAEQDRLRREENTAAIQSLFVRQQSAANQNRTDLSALRESFRQRRASALQGSVASVQRELQGDANFLQFITGSSARGDFESVGGVITRLLQNAAFSDEDLRNAEGSNFSLLDVRQQRILSENQRVLDAEIRAINEEERQALEALIRNKFPSVDAQRQIQNRRELIEAQREVRRAINAQQPTGVTSN